jgi:hypothetical protein
MVRGASVSGNAPLNEWRKAEELRDRYFLYLVASCGSTAPRIQVIQDPWGLFTRKAITATPSPWRLTLNGPAGVC